MNKYEILKNIYLDKILNKLNDYANTPVSNPIAEEQLKIALENTIKEEVENIFNAGCGMGYRKTMSEKALSKDIEMFKMRKKIKEELREEIYKKIISELKIKDKEVLEMLEKKYIDSYGT